MSDLVKSCLIILAILLLGAGIRIHQGAADVRFHADEALYSTYARNAAVHGYWMLNGPVDKPPLSIYANALSMHLFAARSTDVIDIPLRAGEVAAKIPNIFAGMILIALIYALAKRLYSTQTATLAALITAVSPYAIAFSASVFTDMLMLTLMIAALLTASHGKPVWTGGLIALSIWTKPQGILFLPLTWAYLKHGKSRFITMLIIGAGMLWLWDTIRPETSFWTLGAAHINPGRLFSSPDEWLPRLSEWLRHSQKLLGWQVINWSSITLGIITAIKKRRDYLLLLMASGYFAFHWFNAYPTFDRYMLPLVPLLAILAARAIPPRYVWITGLILLISIFTTYDPRESNSNGYITVSAWLNDKPLGTIIYNPLLGWEMGYYKGAWSDKRWVHYPEPEIQAQDALLNPDPAPRYFLIPAENPQPWITALQEVEFSVTLVYEQDNLLVYELIPPWGDASGVESSCAAAALGCDSFE